MKFYVSNNLVSILTKSDMVSSANVTKLFTARARVHVPYVTGQPLSKYSAGIARLIGNLLNRSSYVENIYDLGKYKYGDILQSFWP